MNKKIFTIDQGASLQHFTHSDTPIKSQFSFSNSTSARSKLHYVLSVIIQKIGNERTKERKKSKKERARFYDRILTRLVLLKTVKCSGFLLEQAIQFVELLHLGLRHRTNVVC